MFELNSLPPASVRGWPRLQSPLLLIVETDANARRSLARLLQQRGYRVALARSISEASEMLDDLRFIDSEIDGLIADYRLPDGFGTQVIQDFRHDFLNGPAAMVLDGDNIAMQLWAHARGVTLLSRGSLQSQLESWLQSVSARVRESIAPLQFSA